MPNKMERFTKRARQVLSLAQEEAEAAHLMYIGTEHVLIALFREEGGVASQALKACGLEDITVLRNACTALTKIPKAALGVQLDLNNEMRMMLNASVESARQMQVHFIGTEHLLLGIVSRERSTGTRMLLRLGITPDQVRQQVYDIVQIDPGKPAHFSSFVIDPQVESLYPAEVRRIFEVARERAAQYQSRELEPEHLLLGLLDGDNSATLALFSELGLNKSQAIDAVTGAARAAPKPKAEPSAASLSYSHPTQTALWSFGRITTPMLNQLVPQDILMGLLREDWVLVRLWSLLNVDAHDVGSALARAGLAAPPPPRFSWRATLRMLLFFDFVGLFNRLFRRK